MLLLWIIYVISVLFLLCFRARLFIDALWSPAGKGLTSWLSFVMSNCEVVTYPFVSWVRCCAWLYRFLIFALFLLYLVYILSSNPYPSVIQGFVAYLIKDTALNDLCGKTLGILSLYFWETFWRRGPKNAILALLIDCHGQWRTVSGEPNIHSCSFNNAKQFFIDVSFNTFYSKAKSR